MGYDIYLDDPVTGNTLELPVAHRMYGNNIPCRVVDGRLVPTEMTEAHLGVTYNYGQYYYEATDGDPRFAHDEISAYYADGTTGPIETEYGIRGIYGKSGAASIPMLNDMIERIRAKYQPDGEWLIGDRIKHVLYDMEGNVIKDPIRAILDGVPHTEDDIHYTVSEGDTSDYWECTAANALRPLYQLKAMAELRPDGVWSGD